MARLALCQQLSHSNGNGTNGIHDEVFSKSQSTNKSVANYC